jgi:hypothetical protein
MSCIQMYYVCVFTDIIGQAKHSQCHAYKCTHSTIVYMTLVMPRLSYYVSEDTHIVYLYAGYW